MNAKRRLKSELSELISQEPFFAFLALRLEFREDSSCETAWVDGQTLGYNATWVESLTGPQVRGMIAHEVSHLAYLHPWRREARDPKRWNLACDYSVNGILKGAGFDLPPGGKHEPQFDGLSAEAIYSKLPKEIDRGNSGSDPGGCGEVRDSPPDGAPDQDARAEMEQAVLTAAKYATAAGRMPGGMQRAVTEAKSPPCKDVVAAVLAWAQQAARDDYSWKRPSPRYMALGLYMPSLYSLEVPKIAAGIDTSGSINADSLTIFARALQRVLDEVNPKGMTVLGCDTKVHTVHDYEPGDTIAESYQGGGGTAFGPVFDALKGEDLAGILYLTDLEGPMPLDPGVPVLWVVHDPRSRRPRPSFGDTIYLP